VQAAEAGIVANSDDPTAITDALRIAVAADGARPPRAAIDRYSYATLATEMAEQVERAIAARRGGTASVSRGG
jgi:hypothetical protein